MQTEPHLSSEAMAAYRRAFQRRAQARFQTSAKRRQQALDAARAAIEAVMPCYPAAQRAYLFGSILKPGAFKPASDIDVAVEGADMALCFDI